MIGVQDFIGYYDWTFEYLRRSYGEQAVRDYWRRAISQDSQIHARELIGGKGFDGMYEYWAHTLEMEEAGYTFDRGEDYFRIDMFDCPSKGHLIRRGLAKVDTSITYKFRGKFINYEKIGNGIEVEC